MLKQILVFILVLAGVQGMAQSVRVPNLTTFDDKKIHFGFTLGINTLDFGFDEFNTLDVYTVNKELEESIKSPDIQGQLKSSLSENNYQVESDINKLIPGFTVGIITNYRLGEYFDLRFTPGLTFGNRKIQYNILTYDYGASGFIPSYEVRSTYIDFPLLLKYKSKRMVNQRPYMIGGIAYRLDISKANNDDLIHLNKNQFFFEIGMGLDSYLSFFRFSTEIKYSLGLNNIVGDLPEDFTQFPVYHNAFSRLTSNLLTLSFHFE